MKSYISFNLTRILGGFNKSCNPKSAKDKPCIWTYNLHKKQITFAMQK